MCFYKNKKAQVSAPFELLVAIIVMIFVIIAGNYALTNLSENTCIGNKRQDFSNLISSLREVVLGSDLAYRTIDFSTKACYNEIYERTFLKIENDRQVCERYCGSGTSCILLYYSYENPEKLEYKHPIEPICTYLPTNIIFETTEHTCNIDSEATDETLLDPIGGNIPQGKYKIFKVSGGGANYNVCFVKQG